MWHSSTLYSLNYTMYYILCVHVSTPSPAPLIMWQSSTLYSPNYTMHFCVIVTTPSHPPSIIWHCSTLYSVITKLYSVRCTLSSSLSSLSTPSNILHSSTMYSLASGQWLAWQFWLPSEHSVYSLVLVITLCDQCMNRPMLKQVKNVAICPQCSIQEGGTMVSLYEQCTVYNEQCTMYNVQCIVNICMYTIYCRL